MSSTTSGPATGQHNCTLIAATQKAFAKTAIVKAANLRKRARAAEKTAANATKKAKLAGIISAVVNC